MGEQAERARDLRSNATLFERRFWAKVRNRQLGGLKFKRQVPLGPYVADFFCEEAALIVELDGAGHGMARGEAHDATRDAYLRSLGFEVWRIWNGDFTRDPVATLDQVLHTATERIAARPRPLTRKR